MTVRYEVEFLPVALKQLRALPKETRRLIGAKIDRVLYDLGGDVKKLTGFKNKYRLRAGNYRVLFELEGATVVVYDVGDRKDIYE
jgi:mRNA interferase RelE/StbE